MKSPIFHLIFFYRLCFCLVLFLPACKTVSVINFQILEAPKIILPADISRIAFVDRNLILPSDSVNHYYKRNGYLYEDQFDFTSKMSLNCYKGFGENLSEFFHTDSIPFVVLPKEKEDDAQKRLKPLSWTTVDGICRDTKSDVLLVLDYVRVFVEHEIVKADTYWAFTDINCCGKLSIYDPLKKVIYAEKILSDSLFLESESYSEDRLIYQVIPDRDQLLNDAAYELGRNYVDLISPRWINVSRTYFILGDERFSKAIYFINKNDFEMAIKLWKSVVDEEDLLLAGRASHNIAVAKEATGDLKSARTWIETSLNYYKQLKNKRSEYKKIKAYSLALNSRWINRKKIKRFFGEEN